MLSDEINKQANGISEMGGTVDGEAWAHLVIVRSNLRSIAMQVAQLEAHFMPGHAVRDNEESHEHA